MQQLLRIVTAILIIVFAVFAFSNLRVPQFSDFGLLGFINIGISVYLLLLVARHFFVLFFSMREQIRREDISRQEFNPKISIIVPAYNESIVVAETIRQLQVLDYPAIEVIVIDDGSSDDTYKVAFESARNDKRFVVVRQDNAGKGNALNHGIRLSTSEFVFCMDADSIIAQGSLFAGIRHLSDNAVSAVAGSVYVQNQKSLIGRFQALEYMIGLNFFKTAQSFLGLVTIIPGPSGLFRKADLVAIGGYKTDTFAEDCDVTLQLVMNGKKVVFEPLMEVQTEVPESLIQLVKQRYRWNRGILQAMRKHFGVLLRFRSNSVGTVLVLYLLAESVLLPALNITFGILSLVYTGMTLDFSQLSLWLIQLTLLDLMVVIFALTDTRWPFRLLFYALVNRFTYAFFLEIVRLLSSIEELFGIRMNWGKLERIGVKA